MEFLLSIISLISGAVGGNIAGTGMREKNIGLLGNTIAGIFGGGAGQFILQALGLLATTQAGGTSGHELDIASILTSIGAGGAGGGVLATIVAFVNDGLKKS
ncbi:MAG: hypothetical protein H0V82_08710 [Candidatus Protochlamydia sp.]|nr:hypothetical protein [Candidatus Protochlamydia sp.]